MPNAAILVDTQTLAFKDQGVGWLLTLTGSR